jgi:uncharacterized membrane protein YfcA
MEYTAQAIISLMILSVVGSLLGISISDCLNQDMIVIRFIFFILSCILLWLIPRGYKKARWDKHRRLLTKALSEDRITIDEYYKNEHRFDYW